MKKLVRQRDIILFCLFLLVLLWAGMALSDFPVRPILANDSLSSQFSVYLPLIMRNLSVIPLY